DVTRGLLAVVPHLAEGAPQEYLAAVLAVDAQAQPLAHAVARDHRAGDARRALEVVAGARRDPPEGQLFGGAPAQQPGDHVLKLVLPEQAAVHTLRERHRETARLPARDDGDLVH